MYGYTQTQEDRHPPSIFISYAHQDEKLRAQLETHLAVLERTRGVETWHYRKIGPGRLWQGVIDEELNTADLILLLLSPSFVASDYCWDVELSAAIRRYGAGEALIVPVLLRPVALLEETPLGQFQILPSGAQPVSECRDRDKAFADIVNGIGTMLDQWHRIQTSSPEPTMTWGIRVRGQLEDFSLQRRLELARALRKLTRDTTLELFGSGAGSVNLCFSSNEACLRLVEKLHNDGALSESLNVDIIEVGESIGASLHIASQKVSSAADVKPLEAPPSLPVGDSVTGGFPPLIGGMVISASNPLQPGFKLLADGSRPSPTEEEQVELAMRLRNYLNASLVVQPDLLKVDLSPYDDYCGIPRALRHTELGRDLLAQDVVLKDYTARLLHPSLDAGRAFWSELEEVQTTSERTNAWFRVWITPDDLTVRETGHEDHAEITVEKLGFKVQCEPDYRAYEYLKESGRPSDLVEPEINHRAVEIFKERILPLVHREVCLGDRFGILRQILTVIVMSTWVRQSSLAEPFRKAGFLDSNDTERFNLNVVQEEPTDIKEYYLRSLDAGVWQAVRASYDAERKQIVRRLYMAGGISL
ncbi:MAG: toll/interleukin-1 receptor domain-containing protein [bacterium]|nr:toll/interleukin-1 receptor domain-containing protein [bacterium]